MYGGGGAGLCAEHGWPSAQLTLQKEECNGDCEVGLGQTEHMRKGGGCDEEKETADGQEARKTMNSRHRRCGNMVSQKTSRDEKLWTGHPAKQTPRT